MGYPLTMVLTAILAALVDWRQIRSGRRFIPAGQAEQQDRHPHPAAAAAAALGRAATGEMVAQQMHHCRKAAAAALAGQVQRRGRLGKPLLGVMVAQVHLVLRVARERQHQALL